MSSETDDGGYVHDPDAFDEAGERTDEAADGDDVGGAHPATVDREFGWRGWTLVGVLLIALFVAPALIVLRPPGIPYRVALLALPMVPALLLGVVAVWATTRP